MSTTDALTPAASAVRRRGRVRLALAPIFVLAQLAWFWHLADHREEWPGVVVLGFGLLLAPAILCVYFGLHAWRRTPTVRARSVALTFSLYGVWFAMIVATALVTGPDAVRTSPFGGPAHPALIFLQMLLILAVCIVPVLLGIQAAQRKGVSPHWMWFGLNPLGGWLAYLIIRYGVRSKLRPAAGSRSSLIARDDVVICGHCNQASPWSANWVQDRTRGTPFARPAAPLDMHWRNFCPKCGYLIADTVDLSGRRAWVGGARPAIYDLQPEGVAGKPIVGDEYLVPYGRNVFDLKGYLGELAHEEQVWRDTPAQSTDELIAAVNGADPVLRKAAAVELGNRREASAAASLVKAFEREDGSGQVTYEEALRKIGAPAVAPLSGALNSPQWFVRYRSTWTLKEMVRQSGDPLLLRTFCDVALPSLRNALHDANAHVSRVAAEALELAARRAPDQEAPPRNEEPAGSRVHVGECEKCGHPLKVKAHAVRPAMRLTCRCGHTFELRVPDAILTSRPVVEARAAQAPVLAQPVGDDQLLHESVDRLLYLYRTHPAGFSPAERDECVQEIRRIGEALDRRGGFDLMLRAHDSFRGQDATRNARNLEIMWDRIGTWLG